MIVADFKIVANFDGLTINNADCRWLVVLFWVIADLSKNARLDLKLSL